MTQLIDIINRWREPSPGVVWKFDQGGFMSILPIPSLHCFSIFQRSMIQAGELPLCEVLDSTLIAEAFQEDNVSFGSAPEDVFTPAITLWAMVSQLLFSEAGRSCKAAAGRVVSLFANTTGRVVAQNAGNYCRAKAKIPMGTIRKIALRLASKAELSAILHVLANCHVPEVRSSSGDEKPSQARR